MITSNRMCNDIAELYRFKGYRVICHTGDDEKIDENGECHYKNKCRIIADVNNNWKCDLLIYSSTITAGVDFDQ